MDDTVLKLEHCIEIQDAMRRNKITPAHLKKITSGDFLGRVREVADGFAEIKPIEHLVTLDADAFVPDGWEVVEHQKGAAFKWNAKKVKLWLSKGQQGGKYIDGNKLREEFKHKLVFNANLLDYLLKNPHLIPEEWKGKYIFFWGTIYRDRGGLLYVRYLNWNGSRWNWGNRWLDNEWNSDNPAAVPATLYVSPPRNVEEFLF